MLFTKLSFMDCSVWLWNLFLKINVSDCCLFSASDYLLKWNRSYVSPLGFSRDKHLWSWMRIDETYENGALNQENDTKMKPTLWSQALRCLQVKSHLIQLFGYYSSIWSSLLVNYIRVEFIILDPCLRGSNFFPEQVDPILSFWHKLCNWWKKSLPCT